MRNFFILLFFVVITLNNWAQVPQKMSYQAIVRDATNTPIISSVVGIKISILQTSASGVVAYSETQTATTNANGLVSIEIGTGTVVNGNFATIDWSTGVYFIKTEIDPTGGNAYTISVSSQLLAVPYALYAQKAGSVAYSNVTNKPTNLDVDGTDDVLLTSNQTIAGNKTFTGTTTVAAPVNATDAATKSYVDSYATAIAAKFEESNLLNKGYTDPRDGNHYNVVKIGNQIWMAENLRYLPAVVGTSTSSTTTPYYYVYGYNGTDVTAAKATVNYTTYGVLYNWPAAMSGAASSSANPSGVQGICPPGWHVPSVAEWTQLMDYLGGSSVAGGKLKEIGTTHWSSPNTGASNSSCFTALSGGTFTNSQFSSFGFNTCWWTSLASGNINGYFFYISNSSADLYNSTLGKASGFHIRCIKD